MELALLVYVISVFDSLRNFLPGVTMFGVLLGFISAFAYSEAGVLFKWIKPVLISFALYTVIVGLFVPTQKTAWMMVGAYTAQRVVESPAMQETSGKVITLINQKLDSLIEDTTSKKK